MTHRQFLAWQAWLDDQWNEPSRADYYAMSTACHVRKSQSTEPQKVKFEDFKIPFVTSTKAKAKKPLDPTTGLEMTDEKIARFHRNRALASIGAFSMNGGR